jgi:SAM-dependent methyltransferase
MTESPFAASAHVYDLLYRAAGKDYEREAVELRDLIQSRRPGASSLLDVACGTGAHLQHLAQWYDVAGVDLEPGMLAEARTRLPHVSLTPADMRTFDLGRQFDAVTCLFSAIGYMSSTAELDDAIANMGRHLAPAASSSSTAGYGDSPGTIPERCRLSLATNDGLVAARVVRSLRDGNRTTLELHHLVGSIDGIEYVIESHELSLFSDDEYQQSFERAGLRVDVAPSPHPDRDRYVAW